jgi:hypothetical protein
MHAPLLPGLFSNAPSDQVRVWRLTRATTKAAWYAVRANLPKHEQAVFWGLLAYWNRYQQWPTGMELFEFLEAKRKRSPQHPRYRLIRDINNVRPRLTTMNQRDPAVVVTGPTRLCTSRQAADNPTKKPVLTWRVPQVGDPIRDGRPPASRIVAA